MATPDPQTTGLHILLKLAALVIILAGIHNASDIIVSLLLAIFFVIVLNPLVVMLIHRGLNRTLAITLVMIGMLIVLSSILGILASSMNEFIATLPQYNQMLTHKIIELERQAPFLHLRLSPARLLEHIDTEHMMTFATTFMTQISGAMASVLVLIMTVIFMLFEVRHIPYKLRFALNQPRLHIAGLHQALRNVSRYLALKTLISLMTGLVLWLGLTLLHVQFALMWGVLGFLLNYIPNIGSIISAIPPVIQALLFNGMYEALLVIALFGIVHMVLGNIMEPRLMGHHLGMSTLVVFLSLLFWGWLLGPVGMLLAVPLTSICKIWMETTTGGRRLAVLLGTGRPKAPAIR
ncbi:AI-2E family transporter [Erwinia sp. HR93]|uniref:AI-2E family transporter n=1 Tax=Erwinia sp. HR93 TaxID=3094840 RepID=UPI002ADEE135|nr:AI-2E family transporter [Erwinia sp. HR93]MEA1063047.1 AI-2E family transporter [Erwinia sp. HR93]